MNVTISKGQVSGSRNTSKLINRTIVTLGLLAEPSKESLAIAFVRGVFAFPRLVDRGCTFRAAMIVVSMCGLQL